MEREMKEKTGISAIWKIQRVNRFTGEIIDTEIKKNTIVDNGLTLVRDLCIGTGSAFAAIAIGTGSTGATTSDTSLETEYTREAVTPSAQSSFVVRMTKTFTFGSGVSEDITEAGIFDNATASGSTMFNRNVFSAKSVTSTINLIVTVDITIGRA